MTRAFSENVRQIVHIAMGGCAFLLPFLLWWQAAMLAGTALAFNLFVLPRLGGSRLFRPAEVSHRYYSGIALYPASILAMICILPYRPDIVGAAWGILAFGDGMATIVGRAVGGRQIPWNADKTVSGTLAFVAFGGAAGVALCWWCRGPVMPPPYSWFTTFAPLAAAVVAAAVETIPIRLNDNLSVPAMSAAVMWALSLVSEDAAVAAFVASRTLLIPALLANVVVAGAGYTARTVSISGATAGTIIGVIVLLATGWAGWTLLLVTFAAAVIASRVGLRRKTVLGIAEARGGRRGAGNAIANTGIAAAAAMISITSYAREPGLLGFAAALIAGSSDTIASEIGKAWGRTTYLVHTLRHVPAGTPGAISFEGTAAGLLGALALGAAAVALGIVPARALLAIVLGATAGSAVESVMGATLEPHGIVNNDVLNFLNTAAAVACAIVFAKVLS